MSTLHIHIGGSFTDDARRIVAAAARTNAGQAIEAESHVSFENWDTFFRVLSPTRIALLHHIHAHAVPSVRALSQAVGRDYRRVHGDVVALLASGLIERRGTRLTTHWGGVGADIEVEAPA